MAKSIARGADEETYVELKGLVYSTAAAFARKFGQRDLSEVISEATYHYQRAYDAWDYRRGVPFYYYAYYRIWKGLLESNRTVQRRHFICPRVPMPPNLTVPEKSDFDLEDFLLDLSEDATIVVLMALSSSTDWFVVHHPGGKVVPRNQTRAVMEMMADMGWDWQRIERAFQEIRRLL